MSHHHAKFSGYRDCGSRDTMVLVCHKMLQDHVIEVSCDLIGGTPS